MKETRWIHPIHGRGVRSQNFNRVVLGKPLSDKAIDKYQTTGFYDNRAWYRGEVKKKRAEREVIKRLLYDCEKQDFI